MREPCDDAILWTSEKTTKQAIGTNAARVRSPFAKAVRVVLCSLPSGRFDTRDGGRTPYVPLLSDDILPRAKGLFDPRLYRK
jgi:hypothetical protein